MGSQCDIRKTVVEPQPIVKRLLHHLLPRGVTSQTVHLHSEQNHTSHNHHERIVSWLWDPCICKKVKLVMINKKLYLFEHIQLTLARWVILSLSPSSFSVSFPLHSLSLPQGLVMLGKHSIMELYLWPSLFSVLFWDRASHRSLRWA